MIFHLIPFVLLRTVLCICGGEEDPESPNNIGAGVVHIDNGPDSAWQFCTGALISEQIVLTNVRCFQQGYVAEQRTIVTLGTKTPFEDGIFYYVIGWRKVGSATDPNYNLGLLKLDRPVQVTFFVKPYALPAGSDSWEWHQDDQFMYVYGFGASEFLSEFTDEEGLQSMRENSNYRLMRVELSHIQERPPLICGQIWGHQKNDSEHEMRCLGKGNDYNVRLMPGDNGAPMIGGTDHILYAIACTEKSRVMSGDNRSGLIYRYPVWFYHVDVKSARVRIMAAMKELVKKAL